jgi:hypothetical protein
MMLGIDQRFLCIDQTLCKIMTLLSAFLGRIVRGGPKEQDIRDIRPLRKSHSASRRQQSHKGHDHGSEHKFGGVECKSVLPNFMHRISIFRSTWTPARNMFAEKERLAKSTQS